MPDRPPDTCSSSWSSNGRSSNSVFLVMGISFHGCCACGGPSAWWIPFCHSAADNVVTAITKCSIFHSAPPRCGTLAHSAMRHGVRPDGGQLQAITESRLADQDCNYRERRVVGAADIRTVGMHGLVLEGRVSSDDALKFCFSKFQV